MVEIVEPINVWVFFKNNIVQPYLFFWNNRQIKVDTVNLVHSSKNGDSLFYHFSVSSGSNLYRLRFDLFRMKWFLDAVEEDMSHGS